jgi:hypothetical protein
VPCFFQGALLLLGRHSNPNNLKMQSRGRIPGRLWRYFAISLIFIVFLFVLILLSGRAAVSRALGNHSILTANLATADISVQLGSSDPEAHLKRAEVLYHRGESGEALREIEHATSLRPRDYHLWLSLGVLRDQVEDSEGALVAFNESVRLAPYYAQPRWQRGNLLLRLGRFDEAFADLRLAATSNSELAPNVIDIAWGISKGDPAETERMVHVANDRVRMAFAYFLASHGRADDAVKQFQAVGEASVKDRRELVRRLINAGAFKEAFAVWRTGVSEIRVTEGEVFDGSFEGELNLNELGFGWRVQSRAGVRMSQDTTKPREGARSLRIEFSGDSSPGAPLISQLVVLEPETKYRLTFASRSREIVSGALPLIVVYEAAREGARLGQSAPVPQGTGNWETVSFDFTTRDTTGAVSVTLEREHCSTLPCPIFGTFWLDSLSMEALR